MAATPGIPKNPEITVVIVLIGIWILNALPNVFKRNRKRAPITSLIHACPIKRIGLNDVPNNNKRTITPTIIETMITGFNKNPP